MTPIPEKYKLPSGMPSPIIERKSRRPCRSAAFKLEIIEEYDRGNFLKEVPPKSRCGSVTRRLCPPPAAIHYRRAASLPLKNFNRLI